MTKTTCTFTISFQQIKLYSGSLIICTEVHHSSSSHKQVLSHIKVLVLIHYKISCKHVSLIPRLSNTGKVFFQCSNVLICRNRALLQLIKQSENVLTIHIFLYSSFIIIKMLISQSLSISISQLYKLNQIIHVCIRSFINSFK